MNWIGFKHLAAHRLEQFLRLFVSCKHEWVRPINKIDSGPVGMIYCSKCDEVLIYRDSLEGINWSLEPLVEKHKCQYCGAMTCEPDSECYMAPAVED